MAIFMLLRAKELHAEEAGDAATAEVAAEDDVADGAGAGPRHARLSIGIRQGDQGAEPCLGIAGLGPKGTAANEKVGWHAHLTAPPCLRSAAHSSAVARMAAVMRLQPRLKYLAPKIR